MTFEISDPCSWKIEPIQCDTEKFKLLGIQYSMTAKYYQIAVNEFYYIILREKRTWLGANYRLAGVASNLYNDYPMIYSVPFSVREWSKHIKSEELGHLENFSGRRWIKTPRILYKEVIKFIKHAK